MVNMTFSVVSYFHSCFNKTKAAYVQNHSLTESYLRSMFYWVTDIGVAETKRSAEDGTLKTLV